ncbi:uncharacterized protein N7482_005694 [Penicillium canariense]|uniref:Uncharacterized protein n=1 Tax=Penicillium canariense TaxID=189055 RepID=A0A9W9LNP6_9EURO|nr:uncharacterized protein N7482_005694 [Penicillium canariense]KAJ5166913.1 hypothetical protein N7482_005694 [Penicillium canariense]
MRRKSDPKRLVTDTHCGTRAGNVVRQPLPKADVSPSNQAEKGPIHKEASCGSGNGGGEAKKSEMRKTPRLEA